LPAAIEIQIKGRRSRNGYQVIIAMKLARIMESEQVMSVILSMNGKKVDTCVTFFLCGGAVKSRLYSQIMYFRHYYYGNRCFTRN